MAPDRLPPHLQRLESEAIHILREATADARRPVLLFSGGKDSTVLARLAVAAFHPSAPPMPLLHIDSTFEFAETLVFRDKLARDWGFELVVRRNEDGLAQGISPFVHGSALYTDLMRTVPLKAALDELGCDVIFGGARRDEEKTRAKERVVSIRSPGHGWEPRSQRPELWNLYNARLSQGQTARVFPLSNWTEADIWTYIWARRLPLAPLYFAASRPTVIRDGALLVVDDDRYPFAPGEVATPRRVRFRTVGCWPVTGAIESEATSLPQVLAETLAARRSERQGRLIDTDDGASLESKKRQGYF
ncbi:sulfate adenylyltransferase subunit CysD [soil metagenome]